MKGILHSLQHPGLLRVERGEDFFRGDLGGPEDLDAEDIARIAELDGDAWGISIHRAISPSSQTR